MIEFAKVVLDDLEGRWSKKLPMYMLLRNNSAYDSVVPQYSFSPPLLYN